MKRAFAFFALMKRLRGVCRAPRGTASSPLFSPAAGGLALLLALLLPFSGCGEAVCRCPDAQTHLARQAALDAALARYQTVGASIALISGGQIVDTFVYGRANRADDIPVTEDTYFKIASISKMVSALGVMRLVENCQLELDGDVSDHLPFTMRNPYYPDVPITLRQIMTHTATLCDDGAYQRAVDYDVVPPLSEVFGGAGAKDNFLPEPPGSVSDYSNFGGGMLGVLIEETTGMTVDEYMQRYIFSPLGITAAYHTPNLPYGAPIARVYNVETTGMTVDMMTSTDTHYDADPEVDYVHTAGGLMCTAEGLAKLLVCVLGDGSYQGARILRPETVAAMREMQNGVGSVSCDSDRGLNLNIITDRLVEGRTLYGHQGKAYGMIAAAYGDPDDKTGVVLITNGCDAGTFNSVARIARAVLTAAYEWLGDPQAYTLPHERPYLLPTLPPAPTPGPTLKARPDPTPEPTLAPGAEPTPYISGEDIVITPGGALLPHAEATAAADSEAQNVQDADAPLVFQAAPDEAEFVFSYSERHAAN